MLGNEARLKEIIEDRSVPIPECGCWIWERGAAGGRYGSIQVKGKYWAAHRLSYTLHKEAIPDGLHVLHSCDTPLCVNPAHLCLGTHEENMLQKAKRGRAVGTKLDAKKVRAIKNQLSSKGTTEIAKEFGVSPQAISDIKFGRNWKHL